MQTRRRRIEVKGWDYPRHLEGRAFGVFVHGDTAGTEVLRRSLTDWLLDMHLVQAGHALIDRYIGYYGPYARSHDALDAERPVQEEARNVAREVIATVKLLRDGKVRVARTRARGSSSEVGKARSFTYVQSATF